MSVQTLIATTNQHDHSLLEKMNIQSNAIVGNQTDYDLIEHFSYRGNDILFLSFNEIGVVLNRNNALMRANADYCLFADDDLIYLDNYVEIVENAFSDLPKADVIIFNLIEDNSSRFQINRIRRVHFYNYLRYGTARIAVRLKPIKEHGILFNLSYGGGTAHCHGEDNLFLTDCLKKGLRIYAVPYPIAILTNERESTWNTGYDYKYLMDQGALYREISRYFSRCLCLADAIKHHNAYDLSIWSAYRAITK